MKWIERIPRKRWPNCCQALAKYLICPTEKQVGLAKAWASTYHSDKHITRWDSTGEVLSKRTYAKTAPPPNKKKPNQNQAALSSLRTVKRAENGFQTALCVEQDKHCIQNQKQQHGLSSKENCFQTNFEGTATSCLMSNGLNQIQISFTHNILWLQCLVFFNIKNVHKQSNATVLQPHAV